MTTQQIEYFLQLSEELHYWRTSYKVNITQSALSRQIKALEDELEIELFKRSNRKVELTPAGKFLQQKWKPVIEQLNAATRYARKIHAGEGGSIVINHPGSVSYDLLPALLGRISSLFPEIKVELVQLKHTQEIELMKAFQVDLCYSRHQYIDELLTSKLVRHDKLALVVPEAHPIVQVTDISTATLENERFILSTLTDGETYQMKLGEIFTQYGIVPNVSFESDFGSVLLSLVQRGLGISIMPLSYSYAQYPGVRFVTMPFEVPLYVHWRKEEDNTVIRNILPLI
ncbi:LysR family transcriptional regulator [Chitinophaga pendula]|uniref:LysR substrate-binding domain-containing protein n=1 Tax=Chitinophaga TaxID=79328 RepID=UPI000BB0213C|nr:MULTISPECIES: LysR substrate-binding domain-containing protein [Chitinophaga]ASZ12137.1 LysR family transcriptional regulator [Chitinophaga sp. MD30]UCJ04823.1 LysR family transcriptional regulator [Chitinophaga pendula]